MLGKEIIRKDLTTYALEAESPDDVFVAMNDKLMRLGYVNDSYLENIRNREASYPTALPVTPYPVAIPHTDPVSVIKPFVAPVRLAHPVLWREMSDPTCELSVGLLFMLGFHDPDGHIKLLQTLVKNFQDTDWVERVFAARSDEELYETVVQMNWACCD
jgi:PTS system galactitol-specific IIA component